LGVVTPTIDVKGVLTMCRQGERSPVTGVTLNRLPQQVERLYDLLLPPRVSLRERTQVEIVRGNIACRSLDRSTDLSGLQCRLDHTRNADRDLILKLENVFERTVETVGPQMGSGHRVYQLPRDANPLARLAYRTF